MSETTNNTRRRIRKIRQALDPVLQQQYSDAMYALLRKQRFFLNCRHLAIYIPTQGEINPVALAQLAWEMGKSVYLPVLMPFLHNRLWFAPWHQYTSMQNNRYGIPEPQYHGRQIIPASQLDLVITPLVAFDSQCRRIGMGGGYYDRTFSFLRFRQHWQSPKLVGIGYEFQKIAPIKQQAWDVPLHAVVTENSIYRK